MKQTTLVLLYDPLQKLQSALGSDFLRYDADNIVPGKSIVASSLCDENEFLVLARHLKSIVGTNWRMEAVARWKYGDGKVIFPHFIMRVITYTCWDLR